jgi:hypothetical protein
MLSFVFSSYHINASYCLPFLLGFGLITLNIPRANPTSVLGGVVMMQGAQIDVFYFLQFNYESILLPLHLNCCLY